MVNYSIHTLELETCLSHEDFYELKQALQKQHPAIEPKTIPLKNDFITISFIYRHLSYYGINSITLTAIKLKNYTLRYLLYLYLNPFQALHMCRQPDSCIIEAKKINIAMELILYNLTSILKPEIINTLTLNRLDFCANLLFPSQIQAEEYLSLLKRGIPSKVLSEVKHLNASQHRYTAYKESLLLKCNSYSFQIYPKYRQMIQRYGKAPDNALGMLRLELRASKPKLEQLAKKYNIISPKIDFLQFLSQTPYITKKEIPKIVSKMVGHHNFYRYQKIKSKIMDSDYKDSDKDFMLHIIYYFSKHSSSENFLEEFHLQNKDWKKIIKKFDKIECSPIPIPRTYKFPVYPGVSIWDVSF